MKAITLYQPWASLVAVGAKRFETRNWPTNYRGLIAIHAAKKPAMQALSGVETGIIRKIAEALGCGPDGSIFETVEALPVGSIVAVAEIVRCDKMWNGGIVGLPGAVCIDRPNQYWSPNWQIETDEYLFGDWRSGRYAWELESVTQLAAPIPAIGKQGLWTWDEVGL